MATELFLRSMNDTNDIELLDKWPVVRTWTISKPYLEALYHLYNVPTPHEVHTSNTVSVPRTSTSVSTASGPREPPYPSTLLVLADSATTFHGCGMLLLRDPSAASAGRSTTATLAYIVVEPRWRRRGYATLITKELINIARRLHVRYVDLTANAEAVEIYHRAGFKDIGIMTRFTRGAGGNEHSLQHQSQVDTGAHMDEGYNCTEATESDWPEILKIADAGDNGDNALVLRRFMLEMQRRADPKPTVLVLRRQGDGQLVAFGISVSMTGQTWLGPLFAVAVEYAKAVLGKLMERVNGNDALTAFMDTRNDTQKRLRGWFEEQGFVGEDIPWMRLRLAAGQPEDKGAIEEGEGGVGSQSEGWKSQNNRTEEWKRFVSLSGAIL